MRSDLIVGGIITGGLLVLNPSGFLDAITNPNTFAMSVTCYLLFRMEKTMGGLRDAVLEQLNRKRDGRQNEH